MEIYKRYRPKTLDRVIGNQSTVSSLKNMLERNTLPHVLLFLGPSGCGKTTLARILTTELGCDDLDYTELNCSDFRGIDTVRSIMRKMNLAPIGKCRVYLLDEVHKMSGDGQNAALKMLEDTPPHIYFFLCTTDPNKLIKTLRNRCTEMAVESLRDEQMDTLLLRVCKREKIELEDTIKEDIILSAQGSARMALVLLDKIASLAPEQRAEALAQKVAEENEAIELCRALIKGDPWKRIAEILRSIKGDPEAIRYAVLGYATAILLKGADNRKAILVLDCFKDNFYDSKTAGLVYAAYSVVNSK